MKRTSKCWLSPDGQVITCPDHKIFARRIIAERYPSVLWALSGSGWVIPQHLTTRQRDKIFDLTQEWFGWKKGSISALPFFYSKYSLNLSTTLSFHITHINENKSGVCLALHNWIRRNIAKSPTFPTYHHSLNSALFAA